MSNDRLFRIYTAVSEGPGCSVGVRTGPIAPPSATAATSPQHMLSLSADPAEQASGAHPTQRNMESDDLPERHAHAVLNRRLRALIAGTQDSRELREWPWLDRSILTALRQSSAIGLNRMVSELFDENRPLIPDVIKAACCLFEDGMLADIRLNRMLAMEIIVSSTHLLYVGFQPVYDAASTLRKFIEAQANRHRNSGEFVIQETIFREVANTRPRPPMITAKLRRIVREQAMQRAEEHAAAKKNETLFCMRTYENLIPRFAKGHAEVVAGIMMCNAMIDGASDNELIWKAYELKGQLIDLQPSPGPRPFSP